MRSRGCVSVVQKAAFLRDDTLQSMIRYLSERTRRGLVYPGDEMSW